MERQREKLAQGLSWLQTVETITQPIGMVINVFISVQLLWIAFTKCDFIVYDYDLLRTCLEKLYKCSYNGTVVYTMIVYAVIELLHCLYTAFKTLSRTQQRMEDQMNQFEIYRILLILAVHFVFIGMWYFQWMESKELETKTITLCSDSSMSSTLTIFTDTKKQSLCLRSLYNSMFWSLLVTDLNVFIIFLRYMILLHLNLY